MVYKTCPYCGAALDPGERCDCQEEKSGAAPPETERPQDSNTGFIIEQRKKKVKEGT